MTEFELKEKIKTVKGEIKSINPKHTKKLNEKKNELKELNAQLKELAKNKPVLSKETIKLIDSTLADNNYWEDIDNVVQMYTDESSHNTDVSKEVIKTIEDSILADKSLFSTLLRVYNSDVDNILWYKSELKKLVKKAVKRLFKVFKSRTVEMANEDSTVYIKITKKDLFDIVYKYSILGSVSDEELYDYINKYMIAR